MDEETPRVIDAEFEIVRPARRQPRFWIDWRVFLVIAAGSALGFIRTVTDLLR